MADVVYSTPTEFVVGLFHERATQVHGLRACELAICRAAVRLFAIFDLVIAARRNVERLFHEGANRY